MEVAAYRELAQFVKPGCTGFTNNRYICSNLGGRFAVILHQGNSDAMTSVRVYLIP
jgi:hypothetical protein